MTPFVYQAPAMRVVFGAGRLRQLPDELEALGARRALVLSTPGQRALGEQALALLGGRGAERYAGARMHVPVEVAQDAVAAAQRCRADSVVAIGGGSTIGLAKAIALRTGLPVIAIPTTYAGSEMTPIYGLTEGGLKTTGRDARVLPRTVIYDPELSRALPMAVSVTSAINAMAHAAEGLYARDGNPLLSLFAEEGLRALAQALPVLQRQPDDPAARGQALYGAWLCGTVLGAAGMALHHKLCHTLGGSFNLPHAETHTVILPYALAYNALAAPGAMRRMAAALGAADADAPLAAAVAVQRLAAQLGAPASLRALGLIEADLDRAAELALANAYWNPRPLERDAVRELLQRAYSGASIE